MDSSRVTKERSDMRTLFDKNNMVPEASPEEYQRPNEFDEDLFASKKKFIRIAAHIITVCCYIYLLF